MRCDNSLLASDTLAQLLVLTHADPVLSRGPPLIFGETAPSLGERVARDGAFTGRRGTGEGFPPFAGHLVQPSYISVVVHRCLIDSGIAPQPNRYSRIHAVTSHPSRSD